MSFGKDSIWKNKTDELSVGYTTTVEAVQFTSNMTFNLKKQAMKKMHVTSNFTVKEPADIGACEVYITTDGDYSITLDTGVGSLAGLNILQEYDYILTIRKYGPGKTVIQLGKIVTVGV